MAVVLSKVLSKEMVKKSVERAFQVGCCWFFESNNLLLLLLGFWLGINFSAGVRIVWIGSLRGKKRKEGEMHTSHAAYRQVSGTIGYGTYMYRMK